MTKKIEGKEKKRKPEVVAELVTFVTSFFRNEKSYKCLRKIQLQYIYLNKSSRQVFNATEERTIFSLIY